MADQKPLRLGTDGLPQQFQSGDTVAIVNGGSGTGTATGTGNNVLATGPTLAGFTSSSFSKVADFRIEGTGVGFTGTGAGCEIFQNTGTVFFQAFNRTSIVNAPFNINASTISFQINGFASLGVGGGGAINFPLVGTTASAANAFLDNAASNNLLRSTSSLRYKRDIEDLEPERADAILGLRPIWYRSKAAADNPDWGWYGLGAEEVAKVDPRLVHWSYAEQDYYVTTRKIPHGEDVAGNPVFRVEHTRHLRKGAKLKPDGVQYERLSVLLLSLLQRQDARLSAVETSIRAVTANA